MVKNPHFSPSVPTLLCSFLSLLLVLWFLIWCLLFENLLSPSRLPVKLTVTFPLNCLNFPSLNLTLNLDFLRWLHFLLAKVCSSFIWPHDFVGLHRTVIFPSWACKNSPWRSVRTSMQPVFWMSLRLAYRQLPLRHKRSLIPLKLLSLKFHLNFPKCLATASCVCKI